MAIIVMGNEKGGTGKTTLACNIAALAAIAGDDVLLVDADPHQRTASRWAAQRREMHPEAAAVRCVALTGRTIANELQDLGKRYHRVVVDTGASDSPELRAAATVAAMLVLPVQAEPADLWTLPTMLGVLERAREFNPKLEARVIINRVPYQTIATTPGDVRAWMQDNVPGLPSDPLLALVGRTAYGRAFFEGLAVSEPVRRDARAAAEMERVYEETIR